MSTAKGRTGTVTFDGQFVTISHDGFAARVTHGKGDKKIPLRSISAIQWKDPAVLTNGFIQFTILGGNEMRAQWGGRTSGAVEDENSVVFTKPQADAMRAVKDEIELALAGPVQVQAAPSPAGPPAGWYTDETRHELVRWRDGQQWTAHTQPRQ